MGDMGRDSQGRSEVAKQVAAVHDEFPFDFVIMLGDNVYGSDAPADMAKKFEAPYKPLLDAGVVFHAVLGNHDNPTERFYALFNMGGERYYTFRASKGGVSKLTEGGVRFFALDTGYLDQPQVDWLEKELSSSTSDWKISFFHHPLYSSGRTHGSALESRAVLEPLFVKYGVSAAFSGHDHLYERIKPQKGGIVYWVAGGGGSLRTGDLRATDMTAKGFDRDYHFMIVEITGDDLYFQAISRTGRRSTAESSTGPARLRLGRARRPAPRRFPWLRPRFRQRAPLRPRRHPVKKPQSQRRDAMDDHASLARRGAARFLHYRFVRRDLILVDSVAQLIADILPAAAPDLAVR